MRFALISDVQGNLAALEAVLADIDTSQRSIDAIVSAGDLVGRGPRPNEVINLMRQRDITAVRGNYDDAVAHDRIGSGTDFASPADEESDARAIGWTRRTLTAGNMEYMQALPRDVRLAPAARGLRVSADTGDERAKEYRKTYFMRALFGGLAKPGITVGKRVLVVHGSPRALNEFVRGDTAGSILSVVARDAQADVILSGHARESFRRDHEHTTFIGVGPVSGVVAKYAMVNIAESIGVEFFQVEYDSASLRRDIMESGLPPSLVSALEV